MTPYEASARLYVAAGWSPIPMTGGDDRTAKGRPFEGVTGRDGVLVDATNVEAAILAAGSGWPDVSLRMSRVIGIDVDEGDRGEGKRATGRATIGNAEMIVGTLPPTFSSTARGWESGSRIQFYRLPDWVEDDAVLSEARTIGPFGGYVEVIRYGHRYAKVWPTVHPNGELYRWYMPDGREIPEGVVPPVAALAELPEMWCKLFTRDGRTATAQRTAEGIAKGELLPGDGDGGDLRSERIFTVSEALNDWCRNSLDALRASGWDSGDRFNDRLNVAAFALGGFVPEVLSEETAREVLFGIIRGHGGEPDGSDLGTIRSGLESGMRSTEMERPRLPTAGERRDPFSRYYDGPVVAGPVRGMRGAGGTAVGADCFVSTTGTAWIPDPASGDDGGEVEGPPGVYLPDSFWDARPVFGVLRQAAQVRMASPEGVLVAAIGLTLARVMPNVVLPACVGVEASLNLMVVTCGKSGDGKSVCRKIAKHILTFEGCQALHEYPVGTGEGIAGQYQRLVKQKDVPPFMEPIRWNILATVEESDKIAALASRSGSTLTSELRSAAMGEVIGFGNVGDTKTNMPEGTYRFVLAMCMQPELSGWLLDEKAGGLPQRFLFACVNDARVVDALDPGGWTVRLPFEATPDPVSGAPRGHFVMGVTDAICAEIRAETIARKRASVRQQETKEYDGHGTLMRLKVAGALCLMDSRLSITDEDWRLAGEVAAASKATIAWMQSIQADTAARKAESFRKVKVADAKAITDVSEVTKAERTRVELTGDIISLLSRKEEWEVTKSALKKLAGRREEHLTRVLDDLVAAGKIESRKGQPAGSQGGRPPSEWRLVKGP